MAMLEWLGWLIPPLLQLIGLIVLSILLFILYRVKVPAKPAARLMRPHWQQDMVSGQKPSSQIARLVICCCVLLTAGCDVVDPLTPGLPVPIPALPFGPDHLAIRAQARDLAQTGR